MTEIGDIRELLDQGFRIGMILLEPLEEEIRKLPEEYSHSVVKALPLDHPDGRKIMYYMKDSAAIDFAKELVSEQNEIIGYDLCIYCSGIAPETIRGEKICLEGVVENLIKLPGVDAVLSDYPNTFEVSFKIEGDDRKALREKLDLVHKIVLALSLSNRIGFVVGNISQGERFRGQPFSLKLGLQETNIRALTAQQLLYVNEIHKNSNACAAAEALQAIYSQVNEMSQITMGWAAIEQIFKTDAQPLLSEDELTAVTEAVSLLDAVPKPKRDRLVKILEDPNLVSLANRNERLASSISAIVRMDYDDVYDKVRSMSRQRGSLLHSLGKRTPEIAQHLSFVERVLWGIISSAISTPNPFMDPDGSN
ncbi:MAG: hypothetical protein A2Y69_07015 [Candidatus Aminicenantes bacterium RBG_13_59_9]|nr:MAG: hypothetical protein A2Y69_07015 [Candidatus Aminicenantes bacterium RBG_13_59_9]